MDPLTSADDGWRRPWGWALIVISWGIVAGALIGVARAIPDIAARRIGAHGGPTLVAPQLAAWAASHMAAASALTLGAALWALLDSATRQARARRGLRRAATALGVAGLASGAVWLFLRHESPSSVAANLAPTLPGRVSLNGGVPFLLALAATGWVIGALCCAIICGHDPPRARRPTIMLALAALAVIAVAGVLLTARRAPRPNIVLIVVDALRADHLGCYGYQRPTSPNIDALARRGVLFEDATSQAPWTLPSISSLMTGLHPSAHGAGSSRTGPEYWTWNGLPSEATTLAETLAQAGYRTANFVTVVFVSSHFGLHQGFQHVDEALVDKPGPAITSARLSHRVIRWLRQDPGQPFFAYIHYFDTHHPYMPHPKYDYTGGYRWRFSLTMEHDELQTAAHSMTPRDIAYMEALYDGEINFVDEHLGRVLAELRRLKIEDRTVVILTADHGEEFREHGVVTHGMTMFQTALRVPLIMAWPGRLPPQRRIATPVQLIDLYPTLLDAAGVRATPGLHGRSLLGLAAGHRWPVRPLLSETWVRWTGGEWVHLAALRQGRYKLAINRGRPQYFFDLQADPQEMRNLVDKGLPQQRQMESQLAAMLDALRKQGQALRAGERARAPRELSDEMKKTLRGLGYLQ